jgi:hypothetical protein
MVADHQGSRHQAGVIQAVPQNSITAVRRATLLRCSIFSGRESGVGQKRPPCPALVCLLSPGADIAADPADHADLVNRRRSPGSLPAIMILLALIEFASSQIFFCSAGGGLWPHSRDDRHRPWRQVSGEHPSPA